jgi:single-stranded DNA-binding protein
MQTQQRITLFGTVSNPAVSRTSKNGRKYTAFGVSMIYDRNRQEFSYNVVAWGKQGHFAKSLLKGTRIKIIIQAQSQPDNIAPTPKPPAPVARPVHPAAR